MRGPKPKPTKLKILNGNPGKRPLPRSEPHPDPKPPTCPAWLSAEAKAEWRRILPQLTELELVTQVDRAALAGYCQAWAEFQAATKTLTAEGRTQRVGEDGHLAPHPAIAQQRSALKALVTFGALFGLDPSSRTRLHGPDKRPAGVISFARNRA